MVSHFQEHYHTSEPDEIFVLPIPQKKKKDLQFVLTLWTVWKQRKHEEVKHVPVEKHNMV